MTDVSKVRARKTRSREKQFGRSGNRARSFGQSHILGLLIAVLFWASAMVIIGAETVLRGATDPESVLLWAGNGLFLLVSMLTAGICLEMLRPDILRRNSRILLLCLVSLLSLIFAKAVLRLADVSNFILPGVAEFLIPLALAPLLATILIDSTVGLSLGVLNSLAVSILAGRSFSVFLTGMIASVVAAHAGRNVRTRTKVFRIGLIVSIAEIAGAIGVAAVQWSTTDTVLILHQAGACLLSGFLSAVVALLILPLFESLFGMTTDITLLELSDLGHPLLQRLAIEAPGTYHHSLVLANLAQAAADEIGANSLLARVCAYFHDIGKLTKPDFFAENIRMQKSPHEDLPPSMSTLVITSHVKEGLSLALLHKLPGPVKAIIREHHGNSVVSYFHHKALSQSVLDADSEGGTPAPVNGAGKIQEADFRYPGPRPLSRESAIIALADAVEAASRSMEKTTPTHIEGLVNDIVNGKVEDGQLDESELSFAELTKVKRSFVFTLTNMLHGRIPYPKDEDRDQQQAGKTSRKQARRKAPGPVPDGAGGVPRPATEVAGGVRGSDG